MSTATLERIENDSRVSGTDLAQLLRETLEAHGHGAVAALCERPGVTLETAQR